MRSNGKTRKHNTQRKKRVTLVCDAPEANSVFVAGSFNEWQPAADPLRRDHSGLWETRLTLKPGTYEYRFIVDGEWCDDPQCMAHVENPLGSRNCLLAVE